MINIFNSSSERPSSTTQDALNDLADKWDWEDIVYDTTTPTNVTQLWLSAKLYLSLDTSISHYLQIIHSVGDYTGKISIPYTEYRIVSTDNALLFIPIGSSASSSYFALSRTVDTKIRESCGCVWHASNTYIFTDNMVSNVSISSLMSNSNTYTQLVPVYSWNSDEYFEDVYFTFIHKSNDGGKSILNDNYYYIHQDVALPYTT